MEKIHFIFKISEVFQKSAIIALKIGKRHGNHLESDKRKVLKIFIRSFFHAFSRSADLFFCLYELTIAFFRARHGGITSEIELRVFENCAISEYCKIVAQIVLLHTLKIKIKMATFTGLSF